MADFTELIERLEKLEGPDREVDGLIAKCFSSLPDEARWMAEDVYGEPSAQWVSGGYGAYQFHDPEEYTASLDAAVGLVERMLPGTEIALTNLYGVAMAEVELNNSSTGSFMERRNDGNLVLALLTALCRSLPRPGGDAK